MGPKDPTRNGASGVSSHAGPPFDERRLESELQAAAEREAAAVHQGWRNWSWINRPITIWMLSTIAVGILSFTYAQFSTCRSSLETDTSRYVRLIEELSFRIGAVYGVALRPSIDASAFLVALDPDRQFMFTEFKGRLPNELAVEARQLLRKWYPSDAAKVDALGDQWVSDSKRKIAPSVVPLDENDRSGPRTLEEFLRLVLSRPSERLDVAPHLAAALPGGVFDLLEPWVVIHHTLPVVPSPENVAAVRQWARALGATSATYLDANWAKLGSASVCFERAFWPFK